MKPIRIRRERAAGYNMQVESLTANGLPCIFVGRPTKFGNPFRLEIYGLDLSLQLYRNALHGIWSPRLMSGHPVELRDLAYQGCAEFNDRFSVLPFEVIREELQGYNLSCFCCLAHPCHADELLVIANDP